MPKCGRRCIMARGVGGGGGGGGVGGGGLTVRRGCTTFHFDTAVSRLKLSSVLFSFFTGFEPA